VSRPKRRPPIAMRRAEEIYFGGWKNWENILISEGVERGTKEREDNTQWYCALRGEHNYINRERKKKRER